MRNKLVILFTLLTSTVFAQNILSEEAFISLVKKFHPIAKSASLNVDIAKADLLANCAAFDPAAKFTSGGKTLDNINYYGYTDAQLVIPLWYGMDVIAGIETVKGDRLNPEETSGTVRHFGVSLPLVQHLTIDKRRAALKQAKLMVSASVAEQRSILNHLLRDAQLSYWNWWEQYNKLILVDTILSNAASRLQMVKLAVKIGERPAIDTIEALTQLQTFESEKVNIFMKLQKASLEVSAFLWNNNNEPVELPSDVKPQQEINTTPLLLEQWLNQLSDHPELQQYNFKLASLQIEKKLKFQYLLPQVDVKYNHLQKGNNAFSAAGALFQNNYTYGVTVSVPLRLSQGRGEYQKAKIKIQQMILDQLNKQVSLSTKLKQYYIEWQQTNSQIAIQKKLVNNYTTLQGGEETRFFNGESSIFFINSREQKTLEAKQKLVEIQSKNRQAFADLRWSAAVNMD
jgi:outer membrane protein TolC